MSPKEFDKDLARCHECGCMKNCVYLKAAHVPLYAWVCGNCRDKWVSE